MKRRFRFEGKDAFPDQKRRKKKGDDDIPLQFVDRGSQYRLEKELICGSIFGHINKVSQLLDVGVNANCVVGGYTPLTACVLRGKNLAVLNALLREGAELKLESEWV